MTSPATPSAEVTQTLEPVLAPPRFFFGVSLAAALFFAIWTVLVRGLQVLDPIDQDCASYFRAWSAEHPGMWKAMVFFTDIGGVAAMTLLLILGALWQNALKNRHLVSAWLLIVLGGGMLNMTTKNFFYRARPDENLRDRAVLERNYSYPSGHAMGSAVGYGLLAYTLVLPQPCRGRRIATMILLASLVLAVGFSRIYLRAHWFSDVIAGWSIGLAWLFLCLGWLERRRLGKAPP